MISNLIGKLALICLLACGALSSVSAQTITYIHTDVLGSPVLETNASGTVVRQVDYRAYGEELMDGANPTPGQDRPGFTGHYRDIGTPFVYMQQRYYDPQMGRFLSVDPITVLGGDARHFNRYSYGFNSPFLFFDPDGREPHPFIERAFPEGDIFRTTGEAIGALAAYGVGLASGDAQLQNTALDGMREKVSTGDGVAAAAMLVGPRSGGVRQNPTVHGNSGLSTRPQHRYEIVDNKLGGDVVKTGISGRPLNQNGTSGRANEQVNALNRGEPGRYSSRVVETGIPGRNAALGAERSATNRLSAEGNTLRLQRRPQPELQP